MTESQRLDPIQDGETDARVSSLIDIIGELQSDTSHSQAVIDRIYLRIKSLSQDHTMVQSDSEAPTQTVVGQSRLTGD